MRVFFFLSFFLSFFLFPLSLPPFFTKNTHPRRFERIHWMGEESGPVGSYQIISLALLFRRRRLVGKKRKKKTFSRIDERALPSDEWHDRLEEVFVRVLHFLFSFPFSSPSLLEFLRFLAPLSLRHKERTRGERKIKILYRVLLLICPHLRRRFYFS